ncbi:hypothetical protein KIPB_011090, partial [Kipferlia bialata]
SYSDTDSDTWSDEEFENLDANATHGLKLQAYSEATAVTVGDEVFAELWSDSLLPTVHALCSVEALAARAKRASVALDAAQACVSSVLSHPSVAHCTDIARERALKKMTRDRTLLAIETVDICLEKGVIRALAEYRALGGRIHRHGHRRAVNKQRKQAALVMMSQATGQTPSEAPRELMHSTLSQSHMSEGQGLGRASFSQRESALFPTFSKDAKAKTKGPGLRLNLGGLGKGKGRMKRVSTGLLSHRAEEVVPSVDSGRDLPSLGDMGRLSISIMDSERERESSRAPLMSARLSSRRIPDMTFGDLPTFVEEVPDDGLSYSYSTYTDDGSYTGYSYTGSSGPGSSYDLSGSDAATGPDSNAPPESVRHFESAFPQWDSFISTHSQHSLPGMPDYEAKSLTAMQHMAHSGSQASGFSMAPSHHVSHTTDCYIDRDEDEEDVTSSRLVNPFADQEEASA